MSSVWLRRFHVEFFTHLGVFTSSFHCGLKVSSVSFPWFREAVGQKEKYLDELLKVIADLETKGFVAGVAPPPPKRETALEDLTRIRNLETDLAATRAR